MFDSRSAFQLTSRHHCNTTGVYMRLENIDFINNGIEHSHRMKKNLHSDV